MIKSIDEGLGVTPSAKPLVCYDGWHCDPQCSFLKHQSKDKLDGRCIKTGNELGWYDYYIADCVEN